MRQASFNRLRALVPTISAGIISADLLALGKDLAALEESGVGLVHVDVMDGVFAGPLTVGPPFIKALRTPLFKDVHLMVQDPGATLDQYVAAGADAITVHVEAQPDTAGVLRRIGAARNANDPALGIVRGVALEPATGLAVLEPLLGEVDLVVLLAVSLKKRGEFFVQAAIERAASVREMAARAGRDVLVSIDGGVSRENIGQVAVQADIAVSGSAVFQGGAPSANVESMFRAIAESRRPTAPRAGPETC